MGSQSTRTRAGIAFGRVLHELRRRRKLSQQKIASLVEVDVKLVEQLEAGDREPTLVMLFKLAAALDVDPSYLVARVERLLNHGSQT